MNKITRSFIIGWVLLIHFIYTESECNISLIIQPDDYNLIQIISGKQPFLIAMVNFDENENRLKQKK